MTRRKIAIIVVCAAILGVGTLLVLPLVLWLFFQSFVVPTGAMAPTILGEHVDLACSDCGYTFAAAYGMDQATGDAICPNCSFTQKPGRVQLRRGDRVLVRKAGGGRIAPERWDVIVFKNPNDPSVNFIKRVAGLPGETIELVGGNVTINSRVARKPDAVQDSLWMLVHDTRWRPRRSNWLPRWQAGAPWASSGAGFTLDAPPENGVAWLTYRHLGPDGRLQNILDSYAYNSTSGHHQGGSQVVTDLCLRAPVTLGQTGAAVIIEMRAYKDLFRFELTAEGSDQPTCIYINGAPAAKCPRGVLPVGRVAEVLAANVDHKLMLLVDGRRVASETSIETTPEGDVTYAPTPLTEAQRDRFIAPSADEPETPAAGVRIGVRGGPAKIAHLRLDRDIYYRNETLFRPAGDGMAPGHGTEGNPFTLKEGEYFVLGDNSPRSFDSRLWDLPRPVVPQEYIIGKAILVQSSAGTRWIP